MARKVQIVLEDDINGGIADETVTFALDGTTYEIDLSSSNADELRRALSPYTRAGRKVTKSRTRRPAPGAGGGTGKSGEVRAWARANGIPVSARGRVGADVVAQYEAAHG